MKQVSLTSVCFNLVLWPGKVKQVFLRQRDKSVKNMHLVCQSISCDTTLG